MMDVAEAVAALDAVDPSDRLWITKAGRIVHASCPDEVQEAWHRLCVRAGVVRERAA